MNFVFCDDNTEFLETFSLLVKEKWEKKYRNRNDMFVTYKCTSGEKAVELATQYPIDVLFLDIDMEEMNGFEVADFVRSKNEEVLIVFVSAFDTFVYDSFEFYPLAFLRKTQIGEELPRVLERISELLVENERMSFVVNGETRPIRLKDIVLINSVGNYCHIYLFDRSELTTREVLSRVELNITSPDFVRIHSAYIINMNHIRNIDHFSTAYMGQELIPVPIAQRRRHYFKKAYADYISRRFV